MRFRLTKPQSSSYRTLLIRPFVQDLTRCSSLSETYHPHTKCSPNIEKASENLGWKINPTTFLFPQPKGDQFGNYQIVNTCSCSGGVREYPHVPGMVSKSQSVESIDGRCLIPNTSAETGAVACSNISVSLIRSSIARQNLTYRPIVPNEQARHYSKKYQNAIICSKNPYKKTAKPARCACESSDSISSQMITQIAHCGPSNRLGNI